MQIQTSSTLIEAPADALPEEVVEDLHNAMFFTYGKKYTDQWGGADPDRLMAFWARGLAGFTPHEIKRGIEALANKDWPPSLSEFKRLCRPAIDATVAYYEALEQGQKRERGEMGEWSSPAIYWAWLKIGAFDFNTLSYSQLKSRWEKVLGDELAKGVWERIPEPHIALPAPGQAELTREEADKRIRELHAKGVTKSPEEKTDHRRWAKKIHKRLETGDKSVPAISQKWAKDELGYSQ